MRLIIVFISCILLTACVVGPNYVRPKAPVPDTFKENKKEWKIAAPQNINYKNEWWRIFHDEKLNELESQLNQANQNIINAYYNYQQACALVAEAAANYFPTLTGSANVNRQKSGGSSSNSNITAASSANGSNAVGGSGSGGSSSSGNISTVNQISFNAAWELDIWGAVRRQVESSAANAQANAALLAATRLSMQASLAQFYFELRGVDADQRLLNETVASYQKSLQLTKNQYKAGVVARSDVIQAQALLEGAQSQAIGVGITRAQYEHAIAVLIGVPPASLTIKPVNTAVHSPAIPLMVPSALLERRPDIAQAERLMAQANAQVGVAIAAYFPSVELTAAIIGRGTGLTRWWSLPLTAWSYGGQLNQLILDGGSRRAAVAAAKANYHATVATYRQTVLNAFQDVEDNLVSLDLLKKQLVVQREAANHARKALAIANNQYKAGTVPYTTVLISEVQAFSAQKNEIDVNYQRMTASVALIKALGGGWDGLMCA
jgi:NodT family efflux transporter outer membrane factor (OMF) lipoprotein